MEEVEKEVEVPAPKREVEVPAAERELAEVEPHPQLLHLTLPALEEGQSIIIILGDFGHASYNILPSTE